MKDKLVCPVCDQARLIAPGVCKTCGPIRLFNVRQPRTVRVIYERQVWARDSAHAISIVEQGTAWPQAYDEHREKVEVGQYESIDVTETGYLRSEGGFEEACDG